MDKRRMCPNCRAFITTDDRVCPYCNQRVAPRAVDLRTTGEMIGGFIPHARFVTTLLLIINGGLFLLTSLMTHEGNDNFILYAFGASYTPAIWQHHQYWRLVTAGFLHGGIFHILMNGWVMLDLGAQIEIIYGASRLIVFYVVSTIAGFLLSSWWSPAISIGASAALMGWIGAMIALGVANPTSIGRQIRGVYLRWALYVLAFGLIPGFHVDNAAHIGGIVAGFCLGYLGGMPAHSTYAREQIWKVAAGICILITLVSFYIVYLHFPSQTQ